MLEDRRHARKLIYVRFGDLLKVGMELARIELLDGYGCFSTPEKKNES